MRKKPKPFSEMKREAESYIDEMIEMESRPAIKAKFIEAKKNDAIFLMAGFALRQQQEILFGPE